MTAQIERAPLEDPSYDPRHKPIDGRVPEVVAKWGAASQLRWFRRFWDDLSSAQLHEKELAPFYCHSEQHKGACCASCISEQEYGYFYTDDCCCRADKPDAAAIAIPNPTGDDR